ncbi:hypothetical protein CcCBS67573_g04681 [Chytriomyces confervae]|uniref:Chitin-binding type-4 domain-containing protein n=1 Tax=Chytriomyces confervae TaxID=246404 RepID=A0A507FEQ6_9FUNG|nr:hypothetical protein HDU80_008785 [Chytriomyces hyalinus]TPX74060.1 hypothetical protein CcCBS67573_g04681 [Chytriomyces confervae]
MHPFAAVLVASAAVSLVYSHAVLIGPKSREGMDIGDGIKYVGNITRYAPDPSFPMCAGFPAAAPVQTYTAGSKLDIKWSVTIPHTSDPGVTISIQYQPSEEFMVLGSGIDDALTQASIQLPPNKSSTSAVLRFMWQSKDDGGFYIGCSDIVVNPSKDAVVGPSTITASIITTESPAKMAATGTSKSASTATGPAGMASVSAVVKPTLSVKSGSECTAVVVAAWLILVVSVSL